MFSRPRCGGVRLGVLGSRLLVVVVLALAYSPTASRAGEFAVEDRPAPTSVHEMQGSLERGFEKKPDRPVGPFRPWLGTLPPFLRDTHLGLGLRTYYFDRANTEDPRRRTALLS